MNYPLPMGGFECLGDLLGKIGRVFGGNGSPLEVAPQRLSFDVFEHKESRPVRFVEAIDGGDVGVVERG